MEDFWNDRYKTEVYVYGTAPNKFLRDVMSKFEIKGTILFPAEGEGRNAVYAAKSGLQITAFDTSVKGKNKALKLASLNDVHIDYYVGSLDEMDFAENHFDNIALIYAHFPANIKSGYHQELTKLLKVGGVVIFEAFSKNNLVQKKKYPDIGGPPEIDMLFSVVEIEKDFKGFEIIELKEEIIPLNEGIYHKGMGSVIRFIGRKK